MKTFGQIKDEVLRYFDLATEPDDSADVVMVENAINTANQTRITEDNWKFMLSGERSLAVVAGTQEYILPVYNFNRLHYLYSPAQKRFAHSMEMREVPANGMSFDQRDNVDTLYYTVVENGSVVVAQPTIADTLTLASTDSEATGPQLYIEGENSSGLFISDTLHVGDTSSNIYAKVIYYAKTADFIGTLTLKTTSTQTLVVLGPTEYKREYPILRWHNIPYSNETFVYKYFRKPRVMTRPFDTPDLPFPYSNILVWDALLSLATYNELDSESVNIWRDNLTQAVANLYMFKLNGNVVAGIGNSIVETSMF